MPLYEYSCTVCETKFERLCREGDGAGTPACPACGSNETIRLFSTFATLSGAPQEASAKSGCCTGSCTCRVH